MQTSTAWSELALYIFGNSVNKDQAATLRAKYRSNWRGIGRLVELPAEQLREEKYRAESREDEEALGGLGRVAPLGTTRLGPFLSTIHLAVANCGA
jgi:hypothetical protein